MPTWELRTLESSPRVVQVEATDWLMAMSFGLGQLGRDASDVQRLVCEVAADGTVRIQDPRWPSPVLLGRHHPELVEDLQSEDSALVGEPGSSEMVEPVDDPPTEVPWEEPLSGSIAAEADVGVATDFVQLEAPLVAKAVADAPDDLDERLISARHAMARAADPLSSALYHIQALVPCESGAVLLADEEARVLRFASVTGPRADAVRSLTVPFRKGIAGFCHATGAAIIVCDVTYDPRHLVDLDRRSGYRTEAVLAAAMRDRRGRVLGCVELINPPAPFQSWQLDVASILGRALADLMGKSS
jgi:hypothetical protein